MLAGHRALHPEAVAVVTHPGVLLVGIGVKQDILKLGRDFNVAGDVFFADLGEAARKLGHEGGLGIKKLAEFHGGAARPRRPKLFASTVVCACTHYTLAASSSLALA